MELRENPSLRTFILLGIGSVGLYLVYRGMTKKKAPPPSMSSLMSELAPTASAPRSMKAISDKREATIHQVKSWNEMTGPERGRECTERLDLLMNQPESAWTPTMQSTVEKIGKDKYKKRLYGCIRNYVSPQARDEAKADYGSLVALRLV